MSPSSIVHSGPASTRVKSTTLRPLSGRSGFEAKPEPLRSVRQGQRSLTEHVAPAALGLDVRVAEPELAIERLPVARALQPELGRHHRGVAPHADLLRALEFLLLLVDGALGPGRREQVGLV